jgi:hypothetical protein
MPISNRFWIKGTEKTRFLAETWFLRSTVTLIFLNLLLLNLSDESGKITSRNLVFSINCYSYASQFSDVKMSEESGQIKKAGLHDPAFLLR